MVDVHDKNTRSYNMSRIKGKDTKPELIVRKYLHSKGFRFRLHEKKLPGRPDIVLPKYKTTIHVHGCFWHGHEGCKHFVVPKNKHKWWAEKINRTIERDKENYLLLKKLGWKNILVWECELKNNNVDITLQNLYEKIICQSLKKYP
ncbi:MAG: very short patch repair endonuclease [Candidatus Muiribacteriota bacterium]